MDTSILAILFLEQRISLRAICLKICLICIIQIICSNRWCSIQESIHSLCSSIMCWLQRVAWASNFLSEEDMAEFRLTTCSIRHKFSLRVWSILPHQQIIYPLNTCFIGEIMKLLIVIVDCRIDSHSLCRNCIVIYKDVIIHYVLSLNYAISKLNYDSKLFEMGRL